MRRLTSAIRGLAREQRTVALAAALLLGSMLLPWYTKTVTTATAVGPASSSESKLAITVFSFVEAAIFLVAIGVLTLVLARGEKRAFHLPGGDGFIVALAGAWATFLVFFRFVDQPEAESSSRIVSEYDLSWGIFFGLLCALGLTAAGLRLRAGQVAEPVGADGEDPSGATTPRLDGRTRAARRAEREALRARRDAGEDPWAVPPPAFEGPADIAPFDPGRPRPGRDAAPTVVDPRPPAPRPKAPPPDDQLSFEEP